MEEKKLYTLLVYSENVAGILNQITAVFTRRQVNIESLNVSASSIPGVHKYTITCFCTEEMVVTLCKQMEKKIDVLQANYFTDEEIFIMEACLLKVSTEGLLQNPAASKAVRHRGARIVEVNPTFSIIEKKGLTDDIISLFSELNALGIVRQFVRSGRIAVTRDCIEHLDRYLEKRTQQNS